MMQTILPVLAAIAALYFTREVRYIPHLATWNSVMGSEPCSGQRTRSGSTPLVSGKRCGTGLYLPGLSSPELRAHMGMQHSQLRAPSTAGCPDMTTLHTSMLPATLPPQVTPRKLSPEDLLFCSENASLSRLSDPPSGPLLSRVAVDAHSTQVRAAFAIWGLGLNPMALFTPFPLPEAWMDGRRR